MSPATIVAKPTRTLLSAEEFYDFVHRPENENRFFELVRGEVIEMPPPKKPHGIICKTISRILDEYVEKRQWGYVTSNDSGVVLFRGPDTVRGPDIALFAEVDDLEAVWEQPYSDDMPLLAVEILSPDDRVPKVNRKVNDYLTAGIQLVWVVSKEEREVTVYRPGHSHEVYDETGTLEGYEALPGLKVPVVDLFQIRRRASALSGGAE
jgi:Uma2 family endonuclease